jgi:DNA replication protein DnaC
MNTTEQIIAQLRELRLHGMADSLERQMKTENYEALRFEDRMQLMTQNEAVVRSNQAYAQRRRLAKIPILEAHIGGIDHTLPRDFDQAIIATLCELGWINTHLNVVLTGPTGVGKSYIASALADAACHADYRVRCFRMCKLAEQLSRAHALQRRSHFLGELARTDLLLIDDLTIGSLTDQVKRDLLEILDDRYDRKSTIITTQLGVEAWHAAFGDPTVADAIMDRLVHNAYKLHADKDSESVRRLKGLEGLKAAAPTH